MTRRFYVPTLAPDALIEVGGDEAHHLLHVLRANIGTTVQLFDGKGHEALGVVEKTERRKVAIRVGELQAVSREAARRVILAAAAPRSGRERFLVEKAVELGVAELILCETDRSVSRPSERLIEKAQRTVIEASKQCGRNTLMQISASSLSNVLLDERWKTMTRWIAHPTGMPLPRNFTEGQAFVVAIGPEGGFTDKETELAHASGWRPVSLGPRILRIETAAVAVAAHLLLSS